MNFNIIHYNIKNFKTKENKRKTQLYIVKQWKKNKIIQRNQSPRNQVTAHCKGTKAKHSPITHTSVETGMFSALVKSHEQ